MQETMSQMREVFQVDESGYAAIVRQVRDKEFEKSFPSVKRNIFLKKKTLSFWRRPDETGAGGGNFPAAGKACGSRERTAAGRGRRRSRQEKLLSEQEKALSKRTLRSAF